MSGKEMRYPWASPYEWLAQKIKSYPREKLEELYVDAVSAKYFLKADVLKEMEEDGYYKLIPTEQESDG